MEAVGWSSCCVGSSSWHPIVPHLPPKHPLPTINQNPAMSVAKNHHQIVVRTADAAEKFEWLARLRNASSSSGGVGRAPPLSTTSQQLAATQQGGASAGQSASNSRRTTGGGAEPVAVAAAGQPEKKVRRRGVVGSLLCSSSAAGQAHRRARFAASSVGSGPCLSRFPLPTHRTLQGIFGRAMEKVTGGFGGFGGSKLGSVTEVRDWG